MSECAVVPRLGPAEDVPADFNSPQIYCAAGCQVAEITEGAPPPPQRQHSERTETHTHSHTVSHETTTTLTDNHVSPNLSELDSTYAASRSNNTVNQIFLIGLKNSALYRKQLLSIVLRHNDEVLAFSLINFNFNNSAGQS